MSPANVLPTAPSEHAETYTPQSLYPVLQSNKPEDFRLAKINEIVLTSAQEVNHYRLVAKQV